MGSWYLLFKTDAASEPALEAVVSAVETGLGVPLVLQHDSWGGNPRDGYSRRVSATATIPADIPILIRTDLAVEHARIIGPPERVETARVQVALDAGATPALDRLWGSLAGALGALGYADETLAEAPSGIIDALTEAGAVERVAVLRAAITAALIERIRSGPPHWPLVASFTRPDDLNRVLRAAPAPAQIRSISLSGSGLTALPSVLLEDPVFFPALENLSLSWNPLPALPLLKPRYPKLTRVDIQGCPMPAPQGPDWDGVKIYRG